MSANGLQMIAYSALLIIMVGTATGWLGGL